ncbi:hypothetical protein ACRAD_28210 (plasmid) [Acinetobacter radioresistens DSM 6976 = NBRC 102413 = CIP 103788]|uniref:hypothetical protein n=1 Tax=Acinetobacter radioresistens TaxID=40216 RepID=UPI00028C1C9D|nr:hypothetical protein [Acinetobacter radioresistens]BBL22150.1 hypothetical protein ACRAD_28210 [Acinetobacter radioresistens DSM 6976 = NBRC 102413 = CIP 103788]
MDKLVLFLKYIAILITIFIITNGFLMLTVYGFSIWFMVLMIVEIVLLISQFYLLKPRNLHPLFNAVYILPFPIIYIVTLFG